MTTTAPPRMRREPLLALRQKIKLPPRAGPPQSRPPAAGPVRCGLGRVVHSG